MLTIPSDRMEIEKYLNVQKNILGVAVVDRAIIKGNSIIKFKLQNQDYHPAH